MTAMPPLKTTSAALAGVAVLLLICVQFLPWATLESSGSTPGFNFGGFNMPSQQFDTKTEANTWDVDVTSTTNSGTRTSDEGWYANDFDDSDGIGQIRAAIPILLVSAVVVLVGTLLAMANQSSGAIIVLVGSILLITATVLFATGINTMFDDTNFNWSVAFYLAIAACVTTLAAGVLGLMESNRTGVTA